MKRKSKFGSTINSTYKIFLVLMSSLLIMSKAEGFSILENWFSITGQSLDAYEKCMERQSDILSKNAQKMFCKTKYEEKYSWSYVDQSKALYDGHGTSTRHVAVITNNSSDLIVTRVTWVIQHKDNENDDGSLLPETCESGKNYLYEPLWIEPNGGKSRVTCEVKFIPGKDRRVHENKGGPWSWYFKNIYGLQLD